MISAAVRLLLSHNRAFTTAVLLITAAATAALPGLKTGKQKSSWFAEDDRSLLDYRILKHQFQTDQSVLAAFVLPHPFSKCPLETAVTALPGVERAMSGTDLFELSKKASGPSVASTSPYEIVAQDKMAGGNSFAQFFTRDFGSARIRYAEQSNIALRDRDPKTDLERILKSIRTATVCKSRFNMRIHSNDRGRPAAHGILPVKRSGSRHAFEKRAGLCVAAAFAATPCRLFSRALTAFTSSTKAYLFFTRSLREAFGGTQTDRRSSMGGKVISYGELDTRAARFASEFLSTRLRKGDVVYVMVETDPAFLIVFITLLKIGAIAALLSPKLRGAALRDALSQAVRGHPCLRFLHRCLRFRFQSFWILESFLRFNLRYFRFRFS